MNTALERKARGRRCLVMGLGAFGGGLGVTRELVRAGAAEVVVTDLASPAKLQDGVRALEPLVATGQVRLRLGEHDEGDFRRAELVVANPAVPKPWANPLLAAARAAAQHPKVNSAFAGDSVVEYSGVHLSVAISVEDGLVTPVVRDAQNLSLRGISSAVKDLATRARGKKLKPEEYAGGTLTVSNLGAYGVDSFYAIINPPQAAILAVGAIVKKPVVDSQDRIVVGHRMSVSLSGDHRVVDGAAGAEFLATLRKTLESPAALLL